MPVDMCTKSCSGPIITRSTKCMTGYRTLSTHDIAQVCCGLNRLIREHITCSYKIWIRSVCMVKCHWCSKNVIDSTLKCHWWYYVYCIISYYLSCDKQNMPVIDETKIQLMVFFDFLNKWFSNISNIYNLNVNLSLGSQTKCDNMFSDTKFYYIYFTFYLRTWFIFFSL